MSCLCGAGPWAMLAEPRGSTKVWGSWEKHMDFPSMGSFCISFGFYLRDFTIAGSTVQMCVWRWIVWVCLAVICVSVLSCSGRRRAAMSVPSGSMQAIMELFPVLKPLAGLLVASTYYP